METTKPELKKLKVSLDDLAFAMEDASWETDYYLDLETGQMVMIHSLTTDEPEPKDADLLVTVTNEADLAPLAKLGRKLSGHAQSFGRGGEVFLADPQGTYLGRTCPWKRCGPGIRSSCDALNCGRRLYLHDDLGVIPLTKDLVARPPLELWPQVIARVPLPADIERELIEGLAS